MAAVVGIVSMGGLTFATSHRNQPDKSKLTLFKPLLHFYSNLKQLYISTKMESLIYKGGYGIHISRCLKEELTYRLQINGFELFVI